MTCLVTITLVRIFLYYMYFFIFGYVFNKKVCLHSKLFTLIPSVFRTRLAFQSSQLYSYLSNSKAKVGLDIIIRHLIKNQSQFGTQLLAPYLLSVYSHPILPFHYRQNKGGSRRGSWCKRKVSEKTIKDVGRDFALIRCLTHLFRIEACTFNTAKGVAISNTSHALRK